jgi:tetratricopeptide (TPR) repeat protein
LCFSPTRATLSFSDFEREQIALVRKKRDRLLKKDNVIFFPDLDKRLLEKGLDSLKQKNYREAIKLLSEAKQHNPENEDVFVGLVLAWYEAGNYKEAKALAKEMLQKGIGDYFQIVDLYIMILVQEHRYDEVIVTIEALLEEKEVPPQKLEHFNKLLQFSRKMVESTPNMNEHKQKHVQTEIDIDWFSVREPSEQIQIASRLAHANIRAHMKGISEFLASETGDPFFKTMLLNVLKEQDYDKDLLVKKFARQAVITPNQLFDVHAHPDFAAISDQVRQVLENEDPILMENIKQLMDRYFFLLYPFRIETGEARSWAAAFHTTALNYLGQECERDQIAKIYQADGNEVKAAIDLIGEIEQISSL